MANPEKVKTLNAVHNPVNKEAKNAEVNRKGGKYHETVLRYRSSGVPLLKCKIRSLHNSIYRKYKRIIDPLGLTQIHHEYLNDGTANFRGVALVEVVQHQHGIIDVIQILEGQITLFTDKEIRDQRYDLNGEVIPERSVGQIVSPSLI